jgi:hypothetical protein
MISQTLAFVEKTESREIGSVKMLEEEGFAVKGVDGQMISAKLYETQQRESTLLYYAK